MERPVRPPVRPNVAGKSEAVNCKYRGLLGLNYKIWSKMIHSTEIIEKYCNLFEYQIIVLSPVAKAFIFILKYQYFNYYNIFFGTASAVATRQNLVRTKHGDEGSDHENDHRSGRFGVFCDAVDTGMGVGDSRKFSDLRDFRTRDHGFPGLDSDRLGFVRTKAMQSLSAGLIEPTGSIIRKNLADFIRADFIRIEPLDKAKPVARRGRKTTGPPRADGRVAPDKGDPVFFRASSQPASRKPVRDFAGNGGALNLVY